MLTKVDLGGGLYGVLDDRAYAQRTLISGASGVDWQQIAVTVAGGLLIAQEVAMPAATYTRSDLGGGLYGVSHGDQGRWLPALVVRGYFGMVGRSRLPFFGIGWNEALEGTFQVIGHGGPGWAFPAPAEFQVVSRAYPAWTVTAPFGWHIVSRGHPDWPGASRWQIVSRAYPGFVGAVGATAQFKIRSRGYPGWVLGLGVSDDCVAGDGEVPGGGAAIYRVAF